MKKEFKIGLTGAVALVILFLGIKFLKGQNLFRSSHEYYFAFHNARGLTKNSNVYANGFSVGTVSDIIFDFDHPGNVLVEISVDPRVILRHGLRAQLDAGIMGGCTMNILLPNNLSTIYQPGDTIRGLDAEGLMTKASDMIPQLQQVVAKADSLLLILNRVAGDENIPIIIDNVATVTSDLKVTTAHLNTIVGRDIPRLMTTYNKAGENIVDLSYNLKQLDIQKTLDEVNQTVADVDKVVNELQNAEGTVGKLVRDPSLYNNINHTVQSADSLVTDLKAHPKRYVHFSVFGKKDK